MRPSRTPARAPQGPNAPDAYLWRRAREGSDQAFGALFDRHADRLFRYCQVRLGDRELSQDVVAYVFAEAWRQRDRIVLDGGSLRPWLFGVARNRTSRLRSEAARPALPDGSHLVEVIPDHADRTAERLDAQARCALVLDAIDELTPTARDVVTLAVWGGLTHDQIAATLGIKVGTVKSRLHRARQHLALAIEPDQALMPTLTTTIPTQENLHDR